MNSSDGPFAGARMTMEPAPDHAQAVRVSAYLELLGNRAAKPQLFPLHDEIVIGRDRQDALPSDQFVCIPLHTISRRHVRLRRRGKAWSVEDLHSSNGTFVNGERLLPGAWRELGDGDELALASTQLVFRSLVAPSAASMPTVIRKTVDATQYAPATMSAPMPASRHEASRGELEQSVLKLHAMAQVSIALGAVTDRETLSEKIMNFIFDLFPLAERAFILLRQSERDPPVPVAARRRDGAVEDPRQARLSHTIVDEVLGKKRAILSATPVGPPFRVAGFDRRPGDPQRHVRAADRRRRRAGPDPGRQFVRSARLPGRRPRNPDRGVRRNRGRAEELPAVFRHRAPARRLRARLGAGDRGTRSGHRRPLVPGGRLRRVAGRRARPRRATRSCAASPSARSSCARSAMPRCCTTSARSACASTCCARKRSCTTPTCACSNSASATRAPAWSARPIARWRSATSRKAGARPGSAARRTASRRSWRRKPGGSTASWPPRSARANEPAISRGGALPDLRDIVHYACHDPDGLVLPLLDEHEVAALSLPKGCLTPDERRQIEEHVADSYSFLVLIPWTRDLSGVPAIAHGHHEKLDGSGYPMGCAGRRSACRPAS
jgi:hypothetical protein